MSDAFASFEGHKYLLLTTFRRGGEGVPTAVWFAAGGGALGVFTGPQTGKVKRIRGEGRVRIAPCSFRGRVKGAEQGGAARLVTGEAAERIEAALKAKYGWLFRLITRRRPQPAFIEIAAGEGWAGGPGAGRAHPRDARCRTCPPCDSLQQSPTSRRGSRRARLEVEVASQGLSVEEALANLQEALELHFDTGPFPGPREPRRGG